MSRTHVKGRKQFINSKRYSLMKESLSKASSLLKRRSWTEEERQKASAQRKGKKRVGKAYENVVIAAEKNLEKANIANKKRIESGEYFTKETRKKLSEDRKGKKFTEEHRKNLSISKKRNTTAAQINVSKSYRLVSCIKCKKHMIYSNYNRWHNH